MSSKFETMSTNRKTTADDSGVYDLLTELCSKTASKYCNQNRLSQKRLMTKMRSNAYEIILKKSNKDFSSAKGEPVVDLLSYYFVCQQNARNVAEYKRTVELKKIISTLRQTDFGDNKDVIHSILRFLIGLSNTVKEDLSAEMFQVQDLSILNVFPDVVFMILQVYSQTYYFHGNNRYY